MTLQVRIPDEPCAAAYLIQAYPANGGPGPPSREATTWPGTWASIPPQCPECDGPTIPDRYLNSRAGPGWKCIRDPMHYWQVRMNPLQRFLAAHPRPLTYPWYDTPKEERQAWLDAHYHPPCLTPRKEANRS